MKPVIETDISSIVIDLKNGDEDAFNKLYRMHSKMLLSNVQRLVKDQEIAKELVQDLYLQIWERRGTIEPEKSFKSFLFTIAKNMVLNYLRKTAVDRRARIYLMQNAVEAYSHTEEDLYLKQSTELIKQAVQALPQQCKQVFTLSKLEGKSHQEISSQLGISISTINNHMVKANKEVRAYLLRHGDKAIVFIILFVLGSSR